MIKYSTLKGFFGGNGSPIRASAARYILKDYVNGILVYSYLPPGESKEMTFEARQKQIEFEKINY